MQIAYIILINQMYSHRHFFDVLVRAVARTLMGGDVFSYIRVLPEKKSVGQNMNI